MTPSAEIAFSHSGLILREWRTSDIDTLVQLFDTEEMNRWTPLPSPFDRATAQAYVNGAHEARGRDGTLQLAICLAQDEPAVGEVIVFPTAQADAVELAYAVGSQRRGLGIGVRAVLAVLDLARLAGAQRAVLTIAEDNTASQATAASAGFARTNAALLRRERKGFVLQMETWQLSL